MNIAQLLANQDRLRGVSPAIQEMRAGQLQSITFRELNQKSAQVVTLFHRMGLKSGDRALIFEKMSIDLYVILLACFRSGVVATFLDPSAPTAQIAACCQQVQPQAFIGSCKAQVLRWSQAALRQIPHALVTDGVPWPWSSSLNGAWQLEPQLEIQEVTHETPALLTFTSGSTGQPKAVLRTHGFLRAQHAALIETIQLQPGDSDLSTLPIFALANLASGLTTLIPTGDLRKPGAIPPEPVVDQILNYRPTRAAASPAFFQQLISFCQPRRIQLESLRQIYTGGAPVFPRLLEQLHIIAPQAQLTALYGSTEAEPIAHIHHHQIHPSDRDAMLSGQGLLTGFPVRQIDLRILKSQGEHSIPPLTPETFEDLAQPQDQPGEIVVTGDHVLKGYLGGIGDEQTKFKVGDQIWHRTGDAGYLDQIGRLWLLGRNQAQIQDGRGVLYPFAVESAATQIQGVERAALIQHRQQRVLVVQCCRSLQTSSFQASLQQTLGWAKLDQILWTRRIPVDRRHNAKVDYPALRKWITTQPI